MRGRDDGWVGYNGKEPSPRALRGVGLDAEQVSRFEKFAAGEQPWRLVYSAREAGHLAARPQAARAFCAAFCCKEALYKALGEFYSFPQFECLYRPGASEQEFELAPALKERLAIEEVRVKIDERFLDERGEFVVEVYLTRRTAPRAGFPASYLETLQVAAVEAGRPQIEAEHFSPAEVAAFGTRRAQSVAGALALKRALVRLWAAAGAAGRTPRLRTRAPRQRRAPARGRPGGRRARGGLRLDLAHPAVGLRAGVLGDRAASRPRLVYSRPKPAAEPCRMECLVDLVDVVHVPGAGVARRGGLRRGARHNEMRPIGIFDSGFGGLTIFKGIRGLLPEHDYVYLGDNARTPYGNRSFETVLRFTLEGVAHLFGLGCPLVVIACNTASAKALRSIQQRYLPAPTRTGACSA